MSFAFRPARPPNANPKDHGTRASPGGDHDEESRVPQGYNIAFERIVLTLKAGKAVKNRVLLDNISGSIRKGTLTALMGPSGSGKTSLLSVLAGRVKAAGGRLALSGVIKVENEPVTNWNAYRRLCAYVEQDDLLFPNLTVLETITFAAQLRLPRHFTPAERQDMVTQVLHELGLKNVAASRIGGETVRGISGGERKRVAIALEILRSPKVLMLDECTSGLDAFQALRVVSTIKELAQKGVSVITSIHQPRSSIFALFDSVILMSEGQVVFQGPATEMVAHFSGLGFAMPDNYNPPDWALDLVAVDVRTEQHEKDSRARLNALLVRASSLSGTSAAPAGSDLSSVVVDHDGGGDGDPDEEPGPAQPHLAPRYEASYMRQFRLLLVRAARNKVRDKAQTVVALVTSVFFGLLLGFVYFQTGSNLSQEAINDKTGILFFIALNQGFQGILAAASFTQDKTIMDRERAAKAYGVLPFFLSKVLVDVPSLLNPFILTTIAYFLAGLNSNAPDYFKTVFLSILSYWSTNSIGVLISSFVSSVEKATAIGYPLMLIFVLFSGFYSNTTIIPPALSWIQWIAPMRWVFAGFCVVQFENIDFSCQNAGQQGCIPNGQALINRLGFAGDSFARSVGVLVAMVVGYLVLAYVAIRVRKVKLVRLRANLPKQV